MSISSCILRGQARAWLLRRGERGGEEWGWMLRSRDCGGWSTGDESGDDGGEESGDDGGDVDVSDSILKLDNLGPAPVDDDDEDKYENGYDNLSADD